MVTYESAALGYSDFPLTEEPVYLLGTKYSALYGKDQRWRNNAQPDCIVMIPEFLDPIECTLLLVNP